MTKIHRLVSPEVEQLSKVPSVRYRNRIHDCSTDSPEDMDNHETDKTCYS